MKITFIVPSPQWLTAAGVRIRYKRLKPFFYDKGCNISIIPLQDITERCIQESNVVIISKIFSSDSLYIISLCRTLDVKVGLDLFDDYFSDQRLSVFRKFQDWLELASKIIDFIICSTDRMKNVASDYIDPGLIHKINDTRDSSITFSETEDLLDQKRYAFFYKKEFNVLWFGIGDNPYFSVGINDLANYSNALFQINKLSPSINLTILTNERALSARNLTRISRLPIRANLEIWSESKEIEYLKDSHLAFMPVSHQKFSIAKSSNRCLTALTYGCQVLSNGFDLYSEFSDLIYTSTRDFAVDYKNAKFRFSHNSISGFKSICKHSYDSDVEVSKFLKFLELKVFNLSSTNQVSFCIGNTKPKSLRHEQNFKNSLFPVIDGSTLSITSNTNFGVERYDDIIYFVFSNGLEDLLLESWHKYLRHKYFNENKEQLKVPYRILSFEYVENKLPVMKADLQRVITSRFTEKSSDKVFGLIQSEIHQSIADPSLRKLVRILFGYDNVFYSDCHNRIQPFKAEILR